MSRDPAKKQAAPSRDQLIDYLLFGAEDVDVGRFSRAKTDEVAAYFGMTPTEAFRVLDALARQGVLSKTRDTMKRHRGKTAVGYQWWEYAWRPGDLERYEAGTKPKTHEESPMSRKPKREPTPEEEGAQILESAEKAGADYAQEQLNGDHFRDWVWEQMVEAERMRQADPDSVIPLESPSDAKKLARNMLQQLEWDTKRDMDAHVVLELSGANGVFGAGSADWVRDKYGITIEGVSDAFFSAFDEELGSPSVRQWLTDMVLEMNEEVRNGGEVSETRRHQPRARVEIYAGGASPVYASGWIDSDAAERLATRKRDEADRRGWNHDVRVVPEPTKVGEARRPPARIASTGTSTRGTYPKSPSGQYVLTRDGEEVLRGTENAIWAWMHRNHSFSVDHALKYEGYRIAPVEAITERRRPVVHDYIAVDPSGRTVAGPFADYDKAKREADRARGYVKYASRTREAARGRSRRFPRRPLR